MVWTAAVFVDVLHDADVRRDPLVGEAVGVALVLAGQEAEDRRPQHIGRDDENGLSVLTDLRAFLPGKDLVEGEPVRLGRLHVPAVVEVETEMRLDVPDGLRVLVRDKFHEMGEALRMLGNILPLTVKQGIEPRGMPPLHLAGVKLVHRAHGAEKTLPGDLHVEMQKLEIILRRLLRLMLHELRLLGALEGVERHPVRGHEVEIVAEDPVCVSLRGLHHFRRRQDHLQADLGGLQR